MFYCSLESITYVVYHPWCLSSHRVLLYILSSNFAIFQSTRCSPMREQHGAISVFYLVTLDIEVLGVVDKSDYLLLFNKPIQVLSNVMRLCMFLSIVAASLRQSAYFTLRFSVQPLSGWVGEVDYSPICFLPRPTRLDSDHSCFVLQGVSQHLGYLLLMDYHLCLICTFTSGLHSVLKGPLKFAV